MDREPDRRWTRASGMVLLGRRVVSAIAIVVTGAALVACGGNAGTGAGGTGPETTTGGTTGTASPTETPVSEEAIPTGGGEPVDLRIVIPAGFLRSKIEWAPGAEVSLTLDSKDPIPHNVSVYVDDTREQSIFIGDDILGPRSIT